MHLTAQMRCSHLVVIFKASAKNIPMICAFLSEAFYFACLASICLFLGKLNSPTAVFLQTVEQNSVIKDVSAEGRPAA